MKFLIGKKLGMTQIFDKKKNVIPITLIETGEGFIVQIKNKKKDGYNAVQAGFFKKKKNRVKKTDKGKEFKYIREFKNDNNEYRLGDKIDLTVFEEGEKVKISGISKGKGFQGGIKRWGFKGKCATHGTKKDRRRGGSIGAMGPQRVFKGKKMPGRMGGDKITIKNLEIIKIDKENSILAIKGAVPGTRGTIIEITSRSSASQ